MKTTCQNEQVVNLINRSFDSDGMIIRKGSRKAQKEARAILDNRTGDIEGYVNGYDAHNSLLILAYPARQL